MFWFWCSIFLEFGEYNSICFKMRWKWTTCQRLMRNKWVALALQAEPIDWWNKNLPYSVLFQPHCVLRVRLGERHKLLLPGETFLSIFADFHFWSSAFTIKVSSRKLTCILSWIFTCIFYAPKYLFLKKFMKLMNKGRPMRLFCANVKQNLRNPMLDKLNFKHLGKANPMFRSINSWIHWNCWSKSPNS